MAPLPSSLYVICDADVCEGAGWTLADFASACLDGGARLLQVRAKHAAAGWLLDTTVAIVERGAPSGALVLLNDRADLARLAAAGGVHVGQEDLTPASVRLIVGPDSVVGLSTHTVDQCEAAARDPVSYIAVGPVFGTTTKSTGYDDVGLGHVRRAAARTAEHGIPLVAIGGISLERARSVIEAGAQSIAVITDLLATGDPATRVQQFLRELGEAN